MVNSGVTVLALAQTYLLARFESQALTSAIPPHVQVMSAAEASSSVSSASASFKNGACVVVRGRGLHSSTFQLNLSPFCH